MKSRSHCIHRSSRLLLTIIICITAIASSLLTLFIGKHFGGQNKTPESPSVYPPTTSIPTEQPASGENTSQIPTKASQEGASSRQFLPWTPERTIALPTVQYPPFPPVLPTRPAEGAMTNIYELARGLNIKTQVNFHHGARASIDREIKGNYRMTLSLDINQPTALSTKEDMLKINPKLEDMLPGLSTLFNNARVSPYYGQIYTRKQTEIRKNLASLLKLLDRHNYYDTETILEVTYPETGRKLLWLQSEMDVVSDGSDGDRLSTMSEKILKSSFYQPSTSYRWKKRTDKPNPLLKPWQQRLATYKKTLEKASATDKPALRRKIDHAERVIGELKRYSFLISEYDPFIVIPLGVVNQSTPFSPQFGDYAVVIVGDRLFPALVGDAGPRYKTGEGSLRLSREINPKAGPYSRPVSDLKVSYLIFPGSADPEAGPPDYEKLTSKCLTLLNEIGGLNTKFQLHQWEDLLAPKLSPATPTPVQDAANKPQSHGQKKEGGAMIAPSLPITPPYNRNLPSTLTKNKPRLQSLFP